MKPIRRFFTAGLGLLLLAGCFGGNQPERGTVEGTITVNGVPLERGDIVLRDPAGNASSAGAKIVNGGYTLESPIARMRVEITTYREVPGKFDYSNGIKVPWVEQYLPAKYNGESELVAEVKPGENRLDFELVVAK